MKTMFHRAGYPSAWLLALIGSALVVGLVFALVRALTVSAGGALVSFLPRPSTGREAEEE